jgi:hypothetical protein
MFASIQDPTTLHYIFEGFAWFWAYTGIIFLTSINQLIFLMVMCDVFFEERTELFNRAYYLDLLRA